MRPVATVIAILGGFVGAVFGSWLDWQTAGHRLLCQEAGEGHGLS